MFFCRFEQIVTTFFLVCFFFIIPHTGNAFAVSPSVADVFFSHTLDSVEQIFSLTHTEEQLKTYTAEVRLVVFSEDGNIQDLLEASSDIELSVFPRLAHVLPGSEQLFTVTFGAPSRVTSDQVFALILREQNSDDQQLTPGFIALIFPEGIENHSTASFRIDAFTVGFVEGKIQAITQFTNTGSALIKPQSILIAEDIFGRELFRSVFAEYEGRLPVGTTRVISDPLPVPDFGFWHVGGDVTFSLLSVASGGGDVQQASVTFSTIPGLGVFVVGGCVATFFVSGMVFLKRKRGILHS